MSQAVPRALRALTGEHPELLNPAEPEPDVGVYIPDWFDKSGPAYRTLLHHVEVLSTVRVLTVADGEALALGCEALREYLVARRKSTEWRRADRAASRYWQMLQHFGLTPASRTKISVVPTGEKDPLAEWQASRAKEA